MRSAKRLPLRSGSSKEFRQTSYRGSRIRNRCRWANWRFTLRAFPLTKLLQLEEFDTAQANFNPPQPKNVEEIHATHDQSVRAAEDYLEGMSEQAAQANWRLLAQGKQISSKPRIVVLRSIMLNHWYHHRGQHSVYLRLLELPVPVIYGPSADENPFR
jgi:uncharacterized damage-inducible protein DinB